jgi:hypothetical protein
MLIKIGKTLLNTDLIASADFVQNKHTDDVAMIHIAMAGSRGGDENIVLAKDDAEAFWQFACESLVERDLTPVSQVTAGDLPADAEADHYHSSTCACKAGRAADCLVEPEDVPEFSDEPPFDPPYAVASDDMDDGIAEMWAAMDDERRAMEEGFEQPLAWDLK